MLANWIGETVGLMHKYGITSHQLAVHMGVTPEYISMILNGHREPAGIEDRLRKAISELLVPSIMQRANERIEAINKKNTNDGKEAKTMAAKEFGLTDEQVEREIARLQESQYVKLANKERRVRNRRRMYLYSLRQLEKKGRELEAAGITSDVLDGMTELGDYDEPC